MTTKKRKAATKRKRSAKEVSGDKMLREVAGLLRRMANTVDLIAVKVWADRRANERRKPHA